MEKRAVIEIIGVSSLRNSSKVYLENFFKSSAHTKSRAINVFITVSVYILLNELPVAL